MDLSKSTAQNGTLVNDPWESWHNQISPWIDP